MRLFFIVLSIAAISGEDQCDRMCSLPVNEIDLSKFLSGTPAERQEIASLFDRTFHQTGVLRLVNTNLSMELLDTARRFFALDAPTKLSYFVNGSFHGTAGYKPSGLESVGSTKRHSASIDSAEVFLTFFQLQSQRLNLPVDQLPDLLRPVVPEYILQARQIIAQVHRIADMALGLSENTFDRNYTSDEALYQLRLSKYLPTGEAQSLAFGEHRDYLGFTLLQNDDVPGLEVNVNGTWFRVEPKPDALLLVGGELIQRWTNDYWISILHRVAAVEQFRYSALFFSGPDLSCTIDTLPCEKCTQKKANYVPVTGYEQLKAKNVTVKRV